MSIKKQKMVVLPGDGIGPEVTAVAIDVLTQTCSQFGLELEITEYPFGGISYEQHGTPVTDETIEACKEAQVVLLGAVGGPQWDNLEPTLRPEAALLRLRKELGVYANLRPINVYPALASASTIKESVLEGTDILIVRELTGGVYFGTPRYTSEENGDPYSVDTMRYSRSEVQRVAKIAFEAARLRGGRVCSVDKANVLESSRMWRKSILEIADNYPDVELSHMLVDNCAMQIIRDPKQFDVMVTGNLFGDILSDAASMLTGSLGMLPSASIGGENGLYEPVHGSAPDIAGKGMANPLAAVASAAMLCRYSLKLEEAAQKIEAAIHSVLESGLRTADLYTEEPGTTLAGTEEVAQKLMELLNENVTVS